VRRHGQEHVAFVDGVLGARGLLALDARAELGSHELLFGACPPDRRRHHVGDGHQEIHVLAREGDLLPRVGAQHAERHVLSGDRNRRRDAAHDALLVQMFAPCEARVVLEILEHDRSARCEREPRGGTRLGGKPRARV
jgi:hypothetical protein